MDSSPARRSNEKFAGPKPAARKGVRVVCKIRPFTESEKHCSDNPSKITISRGNNHASVILHDQAKGRKDTYILDDCYEQDESNSKLFAHEVKPLLEGILHGDSCCVIAYGVQGSGKTQLIQGSVETPGLAMMAFCEIFSSIEEVGGSMTISCYEMYNDHIYDLLDCKEKEVQIMEDAEKAIQLKGLSKIPVKSLSDFEKYYFHISNQRNHPQKVENDPRVRSHKGLIMHATSVDKESKVSLVGKLNFMELAGYEEVRKRTDGQAPLYECIKINKSLYALHNVVSALNRDETYIPYRETKLTRLLQDFSCRVNNAVLITCLSPNLCPQTFPVISLASRSCQFVNRQKHDLAMTSKECRRYFPTSSSVGGIHPFDKTIINGGIYQVGSSRKKIKKSISTSNGRFKGHGNRIKKPTPPPCWSKERKLFNVASPLGKTQKLANLCKKEDVSIPDDHIEQSVDSPLAIDIKESHSLEGSSMENEQQKSCFENVKLLPTLTEQLRTLSSQPINMCESKTGSSCNMQFTVDSVEPKTPRFSLSSKINCNSKFESFATPQEKFKTRSTRLKKSLVDEYLVFLNSASKEELKQLKGIGEKRATYILELREETPEPFKEIDDLKGLGLSSKQIKGMMSKILADI
ncbi:kinesin-like protein KIN-10C isoform X2 [Dendrobium catenatum]|uniref:kinesin-like protein KIN-10C isoform X2 n=1 Tax=Dendrobium catenatum TaxID=906689 RepID=UPI0010A04AF0|nr:kinesin-like protein KIN-10C isoform X2 [Dendrobium catenatum]